MFIGSVLQPVIHIDWSDLDPYKRHFLLRASTKFSGRSLVLYQEVHSLRTKEKPLTHKRFLSQLSRVIGSHKQPIIVTDAGFKTPWFREVIRLGWHFVGRSRKPNFYRSDSQDWQCISKLYPNARTTPKLIAGEVNRSSLLSCNLVLYKQNSINRIGKPRKSKRSNDPWLLCTSLPSSRKLAKRVVAIYRTRMQIEEEFRDMKSRQYGLGFGQNKTTDIKRLKVLIFIASFTNIILTIIGLIVYLRNEHKHYQANTVKSRRVLSFQTLGLRSIISKRFRASLLDLKLASDELRILINGLESF